MPTEDAIVELIEYQVILVQPESRKVLVVDGVDGYRLPRVHIPAMTRPAHELQKAVREAWKLHILFLDYLRQSKLSTFNVVAEIVFEEKHTGLKAVGLDQVQRADLSEEQREQIAAILTQPSAASSPVSKIGWIDDAIAWMEASTGTKLSSKNDIEQLNAGGGFSLIRFHAIDGRNFWLKATGEPNTHEFSVTRYLSHLETGYLPTLISAEPLWNAWLMSGEATQLPGTPVDPLDLYTVLEDAVESMARLQMKAQGTGQDLLDAGAFDQRAATLLSHCGELFDYLEEAMSLQTSTKAPRLEKQRIHELQSIVDQVGQRVSDLELPETVVHGDMNWGNILTGIGHCQFIDWCETYLGNPLVTLQHMLLLNKVKDMEIRNSINRRIRQKYLNAWTISDSAQRFEKTLVYMPLMAIGSTLYGRGNWFNSVARNNPHRQSYARTLARYMDRAAREPELLEALCH